MAGPYRTPTTFVPNQTIDDAILNAYLRDQITALKNDHVFCHGRLTATSGSAVPTADASGVNVYFTPYRGNRIGLWAQGPDGLPNWHVLAFSELTQHFFPFSHPDGVYDVFAYANTALWTVELEATGWLNDSTRSVGLSLLDGVQVKSSDVTRRYVGSVRLASTNVFDRVDRRWISNLPQNRVPRPLKVQEATASWTGQTGTPEYVRANSANQVSILSGTGDAFLSLTARLTASNTTAQVTLATGIGENSSVTPAADSIFGAAHTPAANYNVHLAASLSKTPATGYNAYAWLQYSQAAGTTTWLGTSANILQSGMSGFFEA